MTTYQNFQEKMKDKSWTDTLAPSDVKLLEEVDIMAGNLINQIYIFIDLFHQYIDLVQGAAVFSDGYAAPESQDANVSTQTSGNRAERRAKKAEPS